MTYIKMQDPSKLSPEERKMYDNLLAQYPHLRSKMETSRNLDTGTPNPFDAPVVGEQRTVSASMADDDEIDYDAIQKEQQTLGSYTPKPSHLGAATIDAGTDFMQPSVKMTDQERWEEEQRLKQKAERRLQEEEGSSPPKQEPRRRTTPKNEFNPAGKMHPVLARVRQTLGMDTPESKVTVTVGESTYVLKRLSRDEITKATSLATMKSRLDTEIRGNIELSLVAFSVQEIDGATPIEVFEVPLEEFDMTQKRKKMLPESERKEKAAHLFFDFLKEAPTELTETLMAYYEQEFPAFNLLSKSNTNAYCPDGNCQYKAIIGKQDKRFCPYHGSELIKEEALPNPF